MNEILYKFVWRSFIGSYKSVWKYETTRLAKKANPVSPYSLQNRMISFNIAHLAYVILIHYIFGIRGTIFVLCYAAMVIFFQETINYIEHYGLKRKKDENGIFEPVNIKHSWNAPHRYTNYILFKLQRHSDHHAHAYKPYQILDTFSDSPTLLGGYSLALATCLCPPVYFAAYNHLVIAVMEEKAVSKEQIKKSGWISFIYMV
jgi:alkane 1-monooxygenase